MRRDIIYYVNLILPSKMPCFLTDFAFFAPFLPHFLAGFRPLLRLGRAGALTVPGPSYRGAGTLAVGPAPSKTLSGAKGCLPSMPDDFAPPVLCPRTLRT